MVAGALRDAARVASDRRRSSAAPGALAPRAPGYRHAPLSRAPIVVIQVTPGAHRHCAAGMRGEVRHGGLVEAVPEIRFALADVVGHPRRAERSGETADFGTWAPRASEPLRRTPAGRSGARKLRSSGAAGRPRCSHMWVPPFRQDERTATRDGPQVIVAPSRAAQRLRLLRRRAELGATSPNV